VDTPLTESERDWSVEKPWAVQQAETQSKSSKRDGDSCTKMTSLISEYENLLESQLSTQRLHFEKLLARETVRTLEEGLGLGVGAAAMQRSPDLNAGINSASLRTEARPMESGSAPSQSSRRGKERKDEDARSDLSSSADKEDSQLGIDWEAVEMEKMEISALEFDYSQSSTLPPCPLVTSRSVLKQFEPPSN